MERIIVVLGECFVKGVKYFSVWILIVVCKDFIVIFKIKVEVIVFFFERKEELLRV